MYFIIAHTLIWRLKQMRNIRTPLFMDISRAIPKSGKEKNV